MNWQKFLLLMQLAPMILDLVKQVEGVITAKGTGPEKLNLVLDTVEAASQAVPVDQELSQDDLKAATTSIVNKTVQRLNTAGVFHK